MNNYYNSQIPWECHAWEPEHDFDTFVVKPLEGGPLMTISAERVRRFGKRAIYGNATQFTVAELDNGEIVHLKHADQTDPKAFSKFIRKHLKGVWADAGLGQSASPDAVKFKDAP